MTPGWSLPTGWDKEKSARLQCLTCGPFLAGLIRGASARCLIRSSAHQLLLPARLLSSLVAAVLPRPTRTQPP